MAPRLLAFTTLLACATPLPAAITAAALQRHVDILASDAFEGRAPGTAGERKTTDYIVAQWQAIGLKPAGEDGRWFHEVRLVNRTPLTQRVVWRRNLRTLEQDQAAILLLGNSAQERLSAAPLWFAGYGTGAGQADLAGAVVLILKDGPAGLPDLDARIAALVRRGAAAVIAITPEQQPWRSVQMEWERARDVLDIGEVPAIRGAMSHEGAAELIRFAGGDPNLLERAEGRPDFRPRRLGGKADLEVSTQVRRTTSNNVVGRLPGTGSSGEAVMFLGHWDHLGICRDESAADRICNGAVDNASGIAALIEIARGLAAAPRRSRDILFLATTAEEKGLLGAEAFAARPTVKLPAIVAAINLDTIAIAPKGAPVAVMGRGVPALDRLIDETVGEFGRTLDPDRDADALVKRQDGWALARSGVPTLMVGGSFSDMALLGAFLQGNYHEPGDNPGPGLVLDGAAEDSDLLVALGLKLADPERYVPAAGTPARPNL